MNNISIKSSELKSISDSACEILVIAKLLRDNANMDETEMQYALSGLTKLAYTHNGLLFNLIDEGVDDE